MNFSDLFTTLLVREKELRTQANAAHDARVSASERESQLAQKAMEVSMHRRLFDRQYYTEADRKTPRTPRPTELGTDQFMAAMLLGVDRATVETAIRAYLGERIHALILEGKDVSRNTIRWNTHQALVDYVKAEYDRTSGIFFDRFMCDE